MTNKPLEALRRATAGKQPIDTITLDEIPALKRAYDKALAEKKESFSFKGIELLTSYAKYVIEYAETFHK